MGHQWIIFQFITTHEAAFSISNYLEMRGSVGITTIDKKDFLKTFQEQQTPDAIIGEFLEDLSYDVQIEAYFAYDQHQLQCKNQLSDELTWLPVDAFIRQMQQALDLISEISDLGKGYIGYRIMADEDWAETWKNYYQTLRFDHIVVNPSWIEYQGKPNEIILQLDPGSAFGTGNHESTSLLLEMLSRKKFRLAPDQRILDLGTGSGILAIAAAKLFPQNEITAIDIDPHAVEVAKENAANNQVHIHFQTGELKDCPEHFDFILANLIAAIHLDLADLYRQKLNRNGLLLASGIINTRLAEVQERLQANGFAILEQATKNDWYALLLQKI